MPMDREDLRFIAEQFDRSFKRLDDNVTKKLDDVCVRMNNHADRLRQLEVDVSFHKKVVKALGAVSGSSLLAWLHNLIGKH